MMGKFKGTKGRWYFEVTTAKPTDDFQARILSNTGKEFHAGEEKDRIIIIAGEPKRRNGQSNIHSKANAILISKAPEMLEMLEEMYDHWAESGIGENDIDNYMFKIKQLIKEATEL